MIALAVIAYAFVITFILAAFHVGADADERQQATHDAEQSRAFAAAVLGSGDIEIAEGGKL